MKKLNSKGFTLVELLAVIIILAVIVAIAVPTVSNIINESKQASLNDSAELIVRTIENELNIASLNADPSAKTSEFAAKWATDYADDYGYSKVTCTATSGDTAGACVVEFTEVTEDGQFKGFTATTTSYTISNPANLGVEFSA